MASFGHQAYALGSKTVYLKWIKTNHRDIRIVRPGDDENVHSYCEKSGLYGVNGTFYCTENKPAGYVVGNVHRISMYNTNPGDRENPTAAQPVRPIGTTNVDNAGFMFCQEHTSAAIPNYIYSDRHLGTLASYKFQGQHSLDMTNIRWAVGGFGLHLDGDFGDKDTYDEALGDEGAWSGLFGQAPRTAIFYIGGQYIGENIVLLTVFGDSKLYDPANESATLSARTNCGVTPSELRSIIKDVFPSATTHGIMLDGGGSTGIAYKNASGRLETQMVGNQIGNTGVFIPRNANTMIVTPM